MALPAIKLNTLIRELGYIFDSNESLDVFSLHRYQKDIDAIKRVDYFHGILLEAFIAGINNDIQRVLFIAEEGLNDNNISVAWYVNIAKLLHNLGRPIESYAVSIKGLQIFPEEMELARDVMHLAQAFEDESTIANLKNRYPNEFKLWDYVSESCNEDSSSEDILYLLESISSENKATSFTPLERESIEKLLEGVEID